MSDQPKYGIRFIAALEFAAEKHRLQLRKQGNGDSESTPDYVTGIPYMAHLLAVAAIVFEAGGGEDAAIAGLLHDVVEDQGVKLPEISARFGDDVAAIVDGCSEHWEHSRKKPPWEERKVAHLARLNTTTNSDILLVTAADKIHNGESILNDIDADGAKVWERFNADVESILWYYRGVSQVISEHLSDNVWLTKRLTKVVDRLTVAAELRVSLQ